MGVNSVLQMKIGKLSPHSFLTSICSTVRQNIYFLSKHDGCSLQRPQLLKIKTLMVGRDALTPEEPRVMSLLELQR